MRAVLPASKDWSSGRLPPPCQWRGAWAASKSTCRSFLQKAQVELVNGSRRVAFVGLPFLRRHFPTTIHAFAELGTSVLGLEVVSCDALLSLGLSLDLRPLTLWDSLIFLL